MREKTKAKCPKCKSIDLTLTELWKGHYIQWEQEDGFIMRKDGILNPGDPYKVIASCDKCKHRWTIKDAIQITDLIK